MITSKNDKQSNIKNYEVNNILMNLLSIFKTLVGI